MNRFWFRWPRIVAILLVVCSACARSTPSTPAASTTGSGGINASRYANTPCVVMLSFDGFRADFLDRFELPAFRRVMRDGVRAESLTPVFPTKTFPNHYSLATGLTAERHGIVANTFFDPERKASYGRAIDNTVNDGSWYRGEPIWVTAEKQGMVSATAVWLGSEAAIAGVRPTYWRRMADRESLDVRVDMIIEWLRKPVERRPHLVAMYVSVVDDAGHVAAPEGDEVRNAAMAADRALARLLDGLQAAGIAERTIVVLVSDHGLARTSPEQYMAIEDLTDEHDVRLADYGPNANVHVPGGEDRARAMRDTVNAKLQHGRAFLRSEVPEPFHYRADPRIGDVVIIMDEPWQVGPRARAPKGAGSLHGWDPASPNMRAIFVASGPGLPKGMTIPPVRTIDVYPFLCELLGLTPAAGISGESGRISALMLRAR